MIDFRDDALDGGILDRAQLEAQLVIGNFVQALTGTQAEIIFSDPVSDQQSALPESCEPQLPAGWLFEETTRAWVKNP